MKLGVSNLAWHPDEENIALDTLLKLGATGVEVAPTRLGEWSSLNERVLVNFRKKLDDFGLAIPSVQAILFNRPDAQLLGDEVQFKRLREHIRVVGSICRTLGATVAVFGAPNNRRRGDMPLPYAISLGVDRMRKLGDIARESEFILGIEPVPAYYECDFLNRFDTLYSFISDCDHTNVKVHMDTACVALSGDDPVDKVSKYSESFVNFHISEPDLTDFSKPKCDHRAIGEALCQNSYSGWVVIEMREAEFGNIPRLKRAIQYALVNYLMPTT